VPEEALKSFTVSKAYRKFAGQAELLRSESRSRIEYLILTNNIKLLDSYFNLTSKFILIDKLQYVLIRFFYHLAVAYFFGLPCIAGA